MINDHYHHSCQEEGDYDHDKVNHRHHQDRHHHVHRPYQEGGECVDSDECSENPCGLFGECINRFSSGFFGSLVFFMVCINRFSIVVVIIIKLIYASVFMIIINFVINAALINLVFISIIISDHRPDNFPAPGVTSACVSPDISFLRAAASEDHDDDHHVCSCSRP